MARTKDAALHAQRHHDILRAAARVFKAKGFHLARTEDICAEAQLSAGTLFRHFPDKRSMITAIADIEFDNYRTELGRLVTCEGIRWLSKITAEDLAELLRPRGFQLSADSWLELARDPQGRTRLLKLDKQLRQTLTKELRRGQAEGWVDKSLDCQGAANLVLALFSGLLFDAELGLAIDIKATARAMADLFSGFLLPSI
jgi:TetR/AcrR family transcriptional regulator, repressor for uid operon